MPKAKGLFNILQAHLPWHRARVAFTAGFILERSRAHPHGERNEPPPIMHRNVWRGLTDLQRLLSVQAVLPDEQEALAVHAYGVRQQCDERSEVDDHNHQGNIWGEGHGVTLDPLAAKKRENVGSWRVKIHTCAALHHLLQPLQTPRAAKRAPVTTPVGESSLRCRYET